MKASDRRNYARYSKAYLETPSGSFVWILMALGVAPCFKHYVNSFSMDLWKWNQKYL